MKTLRMLLFLILVVAVVVFPTSCNYWSAGNSATIVVNNHNLFGIRFFLDGGSMRNIDPGSSGMVENVTPGQHTLMAEDISNTSLAISETINLGGNDVYTWDVYILSPQ